MPDQVSVRQLGIRRWGSITRVQPPLFVTHQAATSGARVRPRRGERATKSPSRTARALTSEHAGVSSHLTARSHGILIAEGPVLRANHLGSRRVTSGPGWVAMT